MVRIDMFDESTTTMVLGGSPARSGFMEEADSTKARSLSDGRKPCPMGGTPQTPKTHTSDTSDTSGALPGLIFGERREGSTARPKRAFVARGVAVSSGRHEALCAGWGALSRRDLT